MINYFQNGNFILCWASIEYFNDFYLHLLVLGWCNTTCSLSEKLQLIHSTHTWMLRLLPPDRSLGAKEFQSNCLKSVIKSSWLRVPHQPRWPRYWQSDNPTGWGRCQVAAAELQRVCWLLGIFYSVVMEVDSSQLRHPAHASSKHWRSSYPHILSSPVLYLVVANCSVPFKMDFEFDFDFEYIRYDT